MSLRSWEKESTYVGEEIGRKCSPNGARRKREGKKYEKRWEGKRIWREKMVNKLSKMEKKIGKIKDDK